MSKFSGISANVETPHKLELLNPITGEALVDEKGDPAYLMLYSAESTIALSHTRSVADRRAAQPRRKYSAEEMVMEEIEFLVTVTAGWRLLTVEGKPLDVEFSKANARELYQDNGCRWIYDQVFNFIHDRRNFFKG